MGVDGTSTTHTWAWMVLGPFGVQNVHSGSGAIYLLSDEIKLGE